MVSRKHSSRQLRKIVEGFFWLDTDKRFIGLESFHRDQAVTNDMFRKIICDFSERISRLEAYDPTVIQKTAPIKAPKRKAKKPKRKVGRGVGKQ